MVSETPRIPEAEATPPRVPRLGAAASGLVALLLVGALFVIPLLGLVIAPLSLLPVAHFQTGEDRGAKAWGPVVGLLVVASIAGMAALALPLLAAYVFDRYPAPCRPRLRFTWEGDTLKALDVEPAQG